uniref:Peptidase S1 domain-containing protein n=1 Tax=Panagrolaimus sp. JU765 TaxID=591449 RepID=A0AC34R9T9_9BILA
MHCFAKYGTRLEYHSVDKTPRAYKTFKVYVDQVITPDDSCRKLPGESECFCCRNQDIALLHLTEDLEFDEKVGKICLSNDLEEKEETGRVVIGWGVDPMKNATTNILQEVVVPIQDSEEFCGNNTHEKEICAGGLMKGTGKGDSGGPLMMIKNNKWFLHGITSRGDYNHTENGMIKDRASYTDVTKWCSFIEEKTGVACLKNEKNYFENEQKSNGSKFSGIFFGLIFLFFFKFDFLNV